MFQPKKSFIPIDVVAVFKREILMFPKSMWNCTNFEEYNYSEDKQLFKEQIKLFKNEDYNLLQHTMAQQWYTDYDEFLALSKCLIQICHRVEEHYRKKQNIKSVILLT